MTLTETAVIVAAVAASVAAIVAFILFWSNPAKTAQTFALMFSTIRHILRLKKEVKGEKVSSPKRNSKDKQLLGTISSYLDPETRTKIEKIADKSDD